jgi:hypothetical protein
MSMNDDAGSATAARPVTVASNKNATTDARTEPIKPDASQRTDPVRSRTTHLAGKRELSDEYIREVIQRVGRPWFNRKRVIPAWKIRALRTAGFSLRQVGMLYSVSGSTIRRRLQGQ